MTDQSYKHLLILPLGLLALWAHEVFASMDAITKTLALATVGVSALIALLWVILRFSPSQKERRKRTEFLRELPSDLLMKSPNAVHMGIETDLNAEIYLPDQIRTRHVHILGATGSGKTESVILNFLAQDIRRGLGSIILDAKGDYSFLTELQRLVPENQLQVFDLGAEDSLAYDPLVAGSALESAQRLFASFTWSEEYYKSKALSTLQRMFQIHFEINGRNPTLVEISNYIETPKTYSTFVSSEDFPESLAVAEFQDISGLRDQIRSLTIGHLAQTLSPKTPAIDLAKAAEGAVIYFRLQSLMSPQLVSILGRLVINHLSFLAGTAHRGKPEASAKRETKKTCPGLS
jgi:hypothetical protein